jgi:hypothetical protein
MNDLIYTTGVASFIIQIITTIVDTYALSIPTPPSLDVIKSLLWVEYIINFIEGAFYIWMISNFSTIKNITISRYYDWVITTPTMLFTYSMYLLHTKNLEENKNHDLLKIINDEKYTLLTIIVLNWTMLFQRSDVQIRNEWTNFTNWPYDQLPTNVTPLDSIYICAMEKKSSKKNVFDIKLLRRIFTFTQPYKNKFYTATAEPSEAAEGLIYAQKKWA